jgi:hypothetical protein
MSWKVWKQPIERAQEEFDNGYKKGLNLSDWNLAFNSFSSASEFYSKAGDPASAKVAKALAAFSKALSDPQKSENWTDASASFLTSGTNNINVTQMVSTEILAQECKLKAFELRARNMPSASESAQELEKTAKEYLSMSGKNLMLPLLMNRKQISSQSFAHTLIADAAKLQGDQIISSDPKQAADFYRKAAIHMKAAGDIETSQALSGKADDFSTTAVCYFCGREVSGKNVNFVNMRARLTSYLSNKSATQVLPSSLTPNTVIACQGCYSAITIAADEIAKGYYDKVEAEIAQLKKEISQLKNRIVATR